MNKPANDEVQHRKKTWWWLARIKDQKESYNPWSRSPENRERENRNVDSKRVSIQFVYGKTNKTALLDFVCSVKLEGEDVARPQYCPETPKRNCFRSKHILQSHFAYVWLTDFLLGLWNTRSTRRQCQKSITITERNNYFTDICSWIKLLEKTPATCAASRPVPHCGYGIASKWFMQRENGMIIANKSLRYVRETSHKHEETE